MNYLTKLFVPFVAVAALTTWSFVSRADDAKPAADAAATGTISVTVTDSSDKPVEGATVRVMLPHGGATTKPSDSAAKQADGEKPKMAPPVATEKTDKDGKATLKDIPAGDYNINANLKGSGHARDKVTVEAGKNVDVALKLMQGQGNKPAAQ